MAEGLGYVAWVGDGDSTLIGHRDRAIIGNDDLRPTAVDEDVSGLLEESVVVDRVHAALSAFDQFSDVGLICFHEHESSALDMGDLHEEVEARTRIKDPDVAIGLVSGNCPVCVVVDGHVNIRSNLANIRHRLRQCIHGGEGYSASVKGDGAYGSPADIFYPDVSRVDADKRAHLR